jgi:hypothetical protein
LGAGSENLDRLELELRRIPGVSFVGFERTPRALRVQVFGPHDDTAVRRRIDDACVAHVEGPVVVEFDRLRPHRVRLLDVRHAHHEDVPTIEVHLAYGGARTVGREVSDDPHAVALATVQALEKLGAEVEFEVAASAVFEQNDEHGVMMVLASKDTGRRYGVATADTVARAAARATLHALNRFLASQQLAS